MKFKFPNLLVLSINSWNDAIASGNTISNHFGAWDKDCLSNLYLREEPIVNDCCVDYFKISETQLMSGLSSKKQGERIQDFKNNTESKLSKDTVSSNWLKNAIIHFRPALVLFGRDIFWFLTLRKKKGLEQYLEDFQPQIIHMHAPTLVYANWILHYCQQKTNAKVVLFFGDEFYSYKSYWPFDFLYQLWLRYWVRKNLKISSLNYAATPELAAFYSKKFQIPFQVLYKGVAIQQVPNNAINSPVKIIYAGNLWYGRWKTLELLLQGIEKINHNYGLSFTMQVYSGTPLTQKMKLALQSEFLTLHGSVDFTTLKHKFQESDIVLHAESFEKKYTKITKYSFSTKIIDCIQSGKCVMAIGPEELSSIHFLQESKAALVANTTKEIYQILEEVLHNKNILNTLAADMYHFSKDAFDIKSIREKLYHEIINLK